jgi:hypothetical protein
LAKGLDQFDHPGGIGPVMDEDAVVCLKIEAVLSLPAFESIVPVNITALLGPDFALPSQQDQYFDCHMRPPHYCR